MTTGVYAITCTATGEQYVGASVNVEIRWRAHQGMLNSAEHSNCPLQEAWDKHCAGAFQFEILEEVDTEELRGAEKKWHDRLRPAFNIMKPTGLPFGWTTNRALRRKYYGRES